MSLNTATKSLHVATKDPACCNKDKKISYDTIKTQHSQINIFLKDPEGTVTFCKPAMLPWLLPLSFVLPKQCASAHGSCSCQPWSPPSEPTPGRSDSMVCLGFYIIFHMCVPIVLTLISVCVQHMFYWTEWWLWAIIWSKKESYKIRPDGNNQGSTIKKAFIHIVAILPESEPDIEIRFRIIQILSLS